MNIYYSKYQNISNAKHQQGVVLIVCLMLLLVMTLLSVSTMNTSIMQEKMAANAQNSNHTFQAAESAINTQITSILGGDSSELNLAMNSATGEGLELAIDLGANQPTTTAQIRYLGPIITTGGNSMNADSSSTLLNGYRFEINGTGTISAVGAQTQINQGIDYH